MRSAIASGLASSQSPENGTPAARATSAKERRSSARSATASIIDRIAGSRAPSPPSPQRVIDPARDFAAYRRSAGSRFSGVDPKQQLACHIAAQHAGARAQTRVRERGRRQGRFAGAAEPADRDQARRLRLEKSLAPARDSAAPRRPSSRARRRSGACSSAVAVTWARIAARNDRKNGIAARPSSSSLRSR